MENLFRVSKISFCLLFVSQVLLAQWSTNGTHIYNTNSGNIGIGLGPTVVPQYKLHMNAPIGWTLPSGVVDLELLKANSLSLSYNSPIYFLQRIALKSENGVFFEATANGTTLAFDVKANKFSVSSASSDFDSKVNMTSGLSVSGALSSGYSLAVKGKIISEEVVVKLYSNWPDYVFAENYKLKTLDEVETFIKNNSHLPDVPSASEVDKNGLHVGEMNSILLKKVEELTLYMIDQNKKLKSLEEENANLLKQFAELKGKVK